MNVLDIKSVDFVVGYKMGSGNAETLQQPLTINFKDGSQKIFYLKMFSRRFFIKLLRAIRDINPNIQFSETCQKFLALKNPMQLTVAEKQDFKSKRKLLITLFSFFVVMFVLINLIDII